MDVKILMRKQVS